MKDYAADVKELTAALKDAGVSPSYYKPSKRTLQLSVRSVSLSEAVELEKIWPRKIRVHTGLHSKADGRRDITLDEAIQVAELLGIEDLQVSIDDHYADVSHMVQQSNSVVRDSGFVSQI